MSKLTPSQQASINNIRIEFESLIGDWSYDHLFELFSFPDSLKAIIRRKLSALYPTYVKQLNIERDLRQKKQRLADNQTLAVAKTWGKSLIGLIVRVTGTRDGTGIRRVIAINPEREQITCEQLSCDLRCPKFVRNADVIVKVGTNPKEFGVVGITSHHMTNITHILEDEHRDVNGALTFRPFVVKQ